MIKLIALILLFFPILSFSCDEKDLNTCTDSELIRLYHKGSLKRTLNELKDSCLISNHTKSLDRSNECLKSNELAARLNQAFNNASNMNPFFDSLYFDSLRFEVKYWVSEKSKNEFKIESNNSIKELKEKNKSLEESLNLEINNSKDKITASEKKIIFLEKENGELTNIIWGLSIFAGALLIFSIIISIDWYKKKIKIDKIKGLETDKKIENAENIMTTDQPPTLNLI